MIDATEISAWRLFVRTRNSSLHLGACSAGGAGQDGLPEETGLEGYDQLSDIKRVFTDCLQDGSERYHRNQERIEHIPFVYS